MSLLLSLLVSFLLFKIDYSFYDYGWSSTVFYSVFSDGYLFYNVYHQWCVYLEFIWTNFALLHFLFFCFYEYYITLFPLNAIFLWMLRIHLLIVWCIVMFHCGKIKVVHFMSSRFSFMFDSMLLVKMVLLNGLNFFPRLSWELESFL